MDGETHSCYQTPIPARDVYPMEGPDPMETVNPMTPCYTTKPHGAPDRVTEDTQQAIADDLGVSEYLVSKAKTELENSGKQFGPKSLSTDERREQVREFVEDSVHIVHLDNLNIPSERGQKRDAVRSYIEDNPTTPGPGGRFHRLYSVVVSDIQRGVCAPGVVPPTGDSRCILPHISAVPYNRPARLFRVFCEEVTRGRSPEGVGKTVTAPVGPEGALRLYTLYTDWQRAREGRAKNVTVPVETQGAKDGPKIFIEQVRIRLTWID